MQTYLKLLITISAIGILGISLMSTVNADTSDDSAPPDFHGWDDLFFPPCNIGTTKNGTDMNLQVVAYFRLFSESSSGDFIGLEVVFVNKLYGDKNAAEIMQVIYAKRYFLDFSGAKDVITEAYFPIPNTKKWEKIIMPTSEKMEEVNREFKNRLREKGADMDKFAICWQDEKITF